MLCSNRKLIHYFISKALFNKSHYFISNSKELKLHNIYQKAYYTHMHTQQSRENKFGLLKKITFVLYFWCQFDS